MDWSRLVGLEKAWVDIVRMEAGDFLTLRNLQLIGRILVFLDMAEGALRTNARYSACLAGDT